MFVCPLPPAFEETSQIALQRLLGRELSIRSEPGFEVLDPDSVLNLWLLHGDCNRQILMDRVDPIVLAKNVQSATHSFIETPSGDLDRVFPHHWRRDKRLCKCAGPPAQISSSLLFRPNA